MVMDLPQFLQELREALHSHAGVPTHQPLVFLRIGRIFLKTVKKIARIAWLLNPSGEGKQ